MIGHFRGSMCQDAASGKTASEDVYILKREQVLFSVVDESDN